MFSYVLFTALSGAALLPLLLYLRNPCFFQDLSYVISALKVGVEMSKLKKRKPFYSLLDRFEEHAANQPNKPFLVFEESTYTYREAGKMVNKVARTLSPYVQEGDPVAIFLGNEPAYLWLWLGLAKLGCTSALLNCNLRTKSLLHCFSCCEAKLLLVGEDLLGAVEEVLPTLKQNGVHVFILKESCDVEGIESLSDKLQQASDQPLPIQLTSKTHMKSPALYIYTSGTTGLPKAAVITQERLWLASFLASMVSVRSDDVLFVYLPLYHSSGLQMGVSGAIQKGITIVVKRKFSASQFWKDCKKYNVTVIQYVGEIMRYLCNTPQKDTDRDHKVRLAYGNGIRGDTWVNFQQRFGDIKIIECYGATEGNVGFVNYCGKIGSIGRDTLFNRLTLGYTLIRYDTEKEEPVRDARGFCIQVPREETGLCVAKINSRAPFVGYANNKQQTEKKRLRDVFEKGDLYFNTGDLLKIDSEGFLYFQDRIGDTFRWKGENVATTEVADHLLTLDFMEEVNVYGVKVPGHEGRIGMAAVTMKENMDFDSKATYHHVKNYLPSYARPRFIRIQDALSTTATFKLLKVKLAEEGFNPAIIKDRLYILEDNVGYVPMTQDVFDAITGGKMKL
ncbi:long-chain fatty acid transport protein 2-like [Neosynchiropus ocellatus]